MQRLVHADLIGSVGALVREAMRTRWLGKPALAVDAEKERAEGSEAPA
jgi:hypothetical protein